MGIYKENQKVDSSLGTFVIIHGSGEYFGRYKWLANRLNQAGYSVIGGDLPGLGRSSGKKGHIDSFKDYYEVVHDWVTEAAGQEGPVFLLGHSMGGVIVIRYLEEYKPKVKGVILTSPCLGLAKKVSPFLEGLVHFLNGVYPSLCLSAGILPEQVSKDVQIVEQYGTDPLILKKVSVRWYLELKKAMEESFTRIDHYPQVPTLVMQAGDDQIVDKEITGKWVESLRNSKKEYIQWPTLYHELFNEPEKEQVFEKMENWVKILHEDGGLY